MPRLPDRRHASFTMRRTQALASPRWAVASAIADPAVEMDELQNCRGAAATTLVRLPQLVSMKVGRLSSPVSDP